MIPPALAEITVGQVALVATALLVVIGAGVKLWRVLSRLKDFVDDLIGEKPRPGVPARPGVMESLSLARQEASHARSEATHARSEATQVRTEFASLASSIEEVKTLATSVEYHSRANGGGSAYDALMTEVRAIKDGLADHVEQARDIHDEQAQAIANLAEALPIVARSTPHADDAADDGTTGP